MLIKNGTIVNADSSCVADVYILNGKIHQIGRNLEVKDEEVIDATGKLVMPGGVDVHTHFNLDVGIATATDDFYTGTIAAACGGTTTIVDHIGFGPKGCNLKHQLDYYHHLAEGNAVVDYSFHGVIQHVDEEVLKELRELIRDGVQSFKFYLTYGYMLEDDDVLKVLKVIKEEGGIACVHPENDAMIKYLKEYFTKKGLKTPIYHEKSRPEQCEAEAVNRVLSLAKVLDDAPIYIVHLSNNLVLNYIKMAKENGQKNIYVETCPQYLTLDNSLYESKNNQGLKYIMSPPLRDKSNHEKLWDGIKNNDIEVIATDHCPFNFEKEKQLGKDDFTKCPNGIPGVETRLPIIFTEGVTKDRISLNKFVEVNSTSPSKIFGLYPKKGTIAVGSDADIVIFDKDKEMTLTKELLHENVDYTPYEGMKLKGYPVMTISKGKVIVKDNKFIGEKGAGEFIKRKSLNKINDNCK